MSRIARLTVPGAVHHVISRFVDRDWLFSGGEDRARYLTFLGRVLARSDWRCLAYCLMSNHIHLAMVGGRASLESWAKGVNAPFARWMNARHERLGPIFADRPSVYVVPPHREAELIAYIHNNPVRAGVAARASASTWSSHRAFLGLTRRPDWLHVDEALARAGCDASPASFDDFVRGARDTSLAFPEIQRVRLQVRRQRGFEIGTPTLSSPVEVPIVCRRETAQPPSPDALLDAVAAAVGAPASSATRRHARGEVSQMKRIFLHVAVEVGISIAAAAAAINVSRQRGSKLARTPLATGDRVVAASIAARLR